MKTKTDVKAGKLIHIDVPEKLFEGFLKEARARFGEQSCWLGGVDGLQNSWGEKAGNSWGEII